MGPGTQAMNDAFVHMWIHYNMTADVPFDGCDDNCVCMTIEVPQEHAWIPYMRLGGPQWLFYGSIILILCVF